MANPKANERESTKEFDDMLYVVGCPECGSEETYETTASISGTNGNRENVPVCICDACGHCVEKYLP